MGWFFFRRKHLIYSIRNEYFAMKTYFIKYSNHHTTNLHLANYSTLAKKTEKNIHENKVKQHV